MRRRYLTADVFTDRPFGGNPVAVVLDADGLTPAQMQAIAAEFNYSETTFVLPPRDPAHTAWVRIFTPKAELPFAGHPNVGTAFVLARQGVAPPDGRLLFEEKAGLVPVQLLTENGAVVGAELTAPEPLSLRSTLPPDRLAACVSLDPADVATGRHRPTVASVGLPFVVAELASLDALRRARPSLSAYAEALPLDHADAVFIYVRDGGEVRARMFAPMDGILEDPATGSATGAMAALTASLAAEADLALTLTVHQGVEMGRPSRLVARVDKRGGRVEAVRVGGRCVEVMSGTFEL